MLSRMLCRVQQIRNTILGLVSAASLALTASAASAGGYYSGYRYG